MTKLHKINFLSFNFKNCFYIPFKLRILKIELQAKLVIKKNTFEFLEKHFAKNYFEWKFYLCYFSSYNFIYIYMHALDDISYECRYELLFLMWELLGIMKTFI